MAEGDGCADPTNIGECVFLFIGIMVAFVMILAGLGAVIWAVVF